jgi:hypothetical protein
VSSPAVEMPIVRRRRGRPRDGNEPKAALTAWVPHSYHERLFRIAKSRNVTVSKLVCIVLDRALTPRRK